MNIFVVDADPVVAARSLCDKHVVKMPSETAQMLCTVSWGFNVQAPYRVSHLHHPCIRWVETSGANWEWLVRHGLALCAEYTRRYGRIHASEAVIRWAEVAGGKPHDGPLTPFVQAMPEKYQGPDAVRAYRAFYRGDKARFARWKPPSLAPEWWDIPGPTLHENRPSG